MIDILITTLIKRPYVFLFLLTYLVLSIRTRGLTRTILFLIIGYTIAWASEALSIRTGFPYGWYFYIYENLKGEWLNYGVPVWDSVSYVFLCYASMMTARFVKPHSSLFKQIILGAALVVFLDIIIDPVAHLGDQWFLGKIYYYPYPGFYFNVPLANFIGWFFTAALILFIDSLIDRKIPSRTFKELSLFDKLSGPLFYLSIILFNWIITIWIGAYFLAFVDALWIGVIGTLVLHYTKNRAE